MGRRRRRRIRSCRHRLRSPAAALADHGAGGSPRGHQQRCSEAGAMSFINPLDGAAIVFVTAVGDAEGGRAVAAALACADADLDRPALLVEVGGRPPRPTLLASAAAQELEKRLRAHLPEERVAARGQLCQLAVGGDPDGYEAAAAAIAVARGATAIVHLPPELLQPLLVDSRAP